MANATILAFPRRERSGSFAQDNHSRSARIIPFTGVYRMRIPDEDFLIATSAPAKRRSAGRRKLRRPST
jgi:hypothetical protein